MKAPVVTRYTIDGDPRRLGSDEIHIERAKQADGSVKWAVRCGGNCMDKHGEWEYEPMPSSRDDDFLARCRFDSPEAAFAAPGMDIAERTRELALSWATLIEQWHDGVKNPDMWMAAAAGALSAARALFTDGVLSSAERCNLLSECFGKFLRERGYTEGQIAAECAANGFAAPGGAPVETPNNTDEEGHGCGERLSNVSPSLADALDDFDNALSQWARAYPRAAFPEPNMAEVHALLQTKGMTLDAVSASNMRHVVTKLNGLFDAVRKARAAVRPACEGDCEAPSPGNLGTPGYHGTPGVKTVDGEQQ